jgi:hypothetical protein
VLINAIGAQAKSVSPDHHSSSGLSIARVSLTRVYVWDRISLT